MLELQFVDIIPHCYGDQIKKYEHAKSLIDKFGRTLCPVSVSELNYMATDISKDYTLYIGQIAEIAITDWRKNTVLGRMSKYIFGYYISQMMLNKWYRAVINLDASLVGRNNAIVNKYIHECISTSIMIANIIGRATREHNRGHEEAVMVNVYAWQYQMLCDAHNVLERVRGRSFEKF